MAIDPRQADAFLYALVLGTERGGPPELPAALAALAPASADDADRLLGTLALVAQRARLQRAWPTLDAEVPSSIDVTDIYVSDDLRDALMLLLGHRTADEATSDPLVPRVLSALRAHGKRLHPFDLPAFRRAAAAHAHLLHPDDAAALNLQATAGVTASNWLTATPASRDAWFRALRWTDPEASRVVAAEALSNKRAEVRTAIVAEMGVRLLEADLPLLAPLVSDRSGKVTAIVNRLLAFLPGTEQYEARLGVVIESFVWKRTGLLRKRRLTYRNPLSGAGCAFDALGLRLSEIIAALELPPSPSDWPAMDDDVALALTAAALVEGNVDAAVQAAHAGDVTWNDLTTVLAAHGVWFPVPREAFGAVLSRISADRQVEEAHRTLQMVGPLWQDGLPGDVARSLLRSLPTSATVDLADALAPLVTWETLEDAPMLADALVSGRPAAYLRLLRTLGSPTPQE